MRCAALVTVHRGVTIVALARDTSTATIAGELLRGRGDNGWSADIAAILPSTCGETVERLSAPGSLRSRASGMSWLGGIAGPDCKYGPYEMV